MTLAPISYDGRFVEWVDKWGNDSRVHVARDMATWWRDALKADPNAEVSVLAHSLGTSVTHDTLALLATDPPKNAEGFLAGAVRLANLFQVANAPSLLLRIVARVRLSQPRGERLEPLVCLVRSDPRLQPA